MTILKTTLPANSILQNNAIKYDYVDSFQGRISDPDHQLKPIDVAKAFFSSAPKWVDQLFALRNKIVAVVGLKTSPQLADPRQELNNFKGEIGEQIGLFKVFHKNNNEIVLGEDDKHLNFRVSLFLSQSLNKPSEKDLIISTTVTFNNWFGRLYFLPVKPFHQYIVPAMLKGIIRELAMKN
jgi:hypothetical protein